MDINASLDRPLDDLVQEKRKQRRPTGLRRAQSSGQGRADGQQKQTQGQRARGGQQQQQQQQQGGPKPSAGGLGGVIGVKVIVSNLPSDVNEQQIRELFTTTVGPVTHVTLAYNAKSQSTGVATVTFRQAADATKAHQSYNGRLIDGKRPMKVEIVVDPSRVPAAPLAARLGAAPQQPKAASATVAAAGGQARQPRQAGTGGRRGGRGAGNRSAPRPKATVESLDAEMSDWQASAGADATTSTA